MTDRTDRVRTAMRHMNERMKSDDNDPDRHFHRTKPALRRMFVASSSSSALPHSINMASPLERKERKDRGDERRWKEKRENEKDPWLDDREPEKKKRVMHRCNFPNSTEEREKDNGRMDRIVSQ